MSDYAQLLGEVSEEEAEIDKIKRRQAQLEAEFEKFSRGFSDSLKSALALSKALRPPQEWVFDARLPNTTFDQLELPSRGPTGKVVRWLVGRHNLMCTIDLWRHAHGRVVVRDVAFPHETFSESFCVTVDGMRLPWLDIRKDTYETSIPNAPSHKLTLELAINPHLLDQSGGVAFAISRIELIATRI